MSDDIPPDFRRSCLCNAKFSSAGGFHLCERGVMQRAMSTEASFGYFMVTENMWKHAYASGVSPRN